MQFALPLRQSVQRDILFSCPYVAVVHSLQRLSNERTQQVVPVRGSKEGQKYLQEEKSESENILVKFYKIILSPLISAL